MFKCRFITGHRSIFYAGLVETAPTFILVSIFPIADSVLLFFRRFVKFNQITVLRISELLHKSFTPELRQHLQHVLADLFRIIVKAGADDPESVRRQGSAMQLVGQVLLVLLIFLV